MDKLEFRQGDVGFVRTAIPAGATKIKNRPFALGEVTGHSHRPVADVADLVEMYEKDGLTYIRALGDIPVQHEDHDPKAERSILPKGWEGEVRIAREYDEEGDFQVAD